MPRVENTSERPYGLSAAGFAYVTVPPARVDTHGTKTNGSADVDAEMLKLVKAEAWGEAVFGCGDLVEILSATKPAPKPKASDDDEKAKTSK